MAGTALPRRLTWHTAKVLETLEETPRVRTLVLECRDWPGHLAGQHVDVRLTAEDGYQAERSYSLASAPEDHRLALTVERLEEGEVSRYLVDELRAGDELEVRGPIGGYFVWEASLGGPVLLIAGGSGVVPFRSMLRHRLASHSMVPMRLLYSARSPSHIIYKEELARAAAEPGIMIHLTLTREWPKEWQGYRRRVDMDLLREISWPPADRPLVYVCGPTEFVEAAATALVQLGHAPNLIKTERFGPTGK